MYDVTPIRDYILFLKKKHGLSVSLHPQGYSSLLLSTELSAFNLHDNSYCVFIKIFPAAQQHCVAKQHTVTERCQGGPFCGICYAGVRELVYPLTDGDAILGFLSVSGYQCEQPESYLQKVSEQYGIPTDQLRRAYSALQPSIPDRAEVDILLLPLCQMLELALLKTKMPPPQELPLARQVMRYLKQNHNQPIHSEDICRQLGCSRSHMSTEFNQAYGKSLREVLNELRVADAKNLLLHSDLTVTEIAYSVGFTDSNYFSSLFKKQTGTTPMEYRKNKA